MATGETMTTIILDEHVEESFLAERRAKGHDRHDEVWEGVYVVSPDPNFEHQRIVLQLAVILKLVVEPELGGEAFPGCNISDRDEDWEKNFRCPDVAVFLPGNPAVVRQTHSIGGPDFAVEIASKNDRTWEKLDFYAQVHTRELLILDRNPWKLTLLHLADGEMKVVGNSSRENDRAVESAVVPLSFRLIWREGNPEIEVKHLRDGRVWHAPAVGKFG
jgi:Uma2 family endonuclease